MLKKAAPIFYDANGKRKRIVVVIIGILNLVIGCEIALFTLSLWVPPALPKTIENPSITRDSSEFLLQVLTGNQITYEEVIFDRLRCEFFDRVARQNAEQPVLPGPPNGIIAAFYTPWQEMGYRSLAANADKLTHLLPEWLHLKSNGELSFSGWDTSANPKNLDVADTARKHGLKIMPVLNNAENGQFDPERANKLLSSPRAQRALARSLRKWLVYEGFHGINVDLENLYPGDYKKLPDFLKVLRREFKNEKLVISVDIEASKADLSLKPISDNCDFIVLMAYDEHYVSGKPGPIAPIRWCDRVIRKALHSVPPEKLVVGIGNYAYDWTEGKSGAESLTYHAALALAKENYTVEPPEDIIKFDPDALNPTFTYQDKEGREHQVWLLDAVTAYNQRHIANLHHLRGSALWVLGSEDPSIWTLLNRRAMGEPLDARSLKTIKFPRKIALNGSGELLSVRSVWNRGRRRVEVDGRTELCVSEEYLSIPSPGIIEKSGYKPKTVAITFDDGPSGKFTPKILSELKRLKVPATFFVVGENAKRHPDLIQRIQAEGHEVGNHTFSHQNIARMSERRAALELNATQRVITNVLGKSTSLFRPPYRASTQAANAEQVRTIIRASKLGYRTVGEGLDPQDWKLYELADNGKKRKRTPSDIANKVLRQAHSQRSSTIILHDGGGDRSLTVKALPLIVSKLRREGYRFVTISKLTDQPSEKVMVPLSKQALLLVSSNQVMLGSVSSLEKFLRIAFMIGIALGIGRFGFMLIFAIIAKFRARKHIGHGMSYEPAVTVIIPAYNEQSTIRRTIESVLANYYHRFEVIVVDDGSTDGTAGEVQQSFESNGRVRLIMQDNAGKAAALNNAIALAQGEVLVCLDADTQITKKSIGLLARHFSDGRVASVAGNVKVGNRINVLTKLQSIEYVTSQNIDRRALEMLNAITVTPGAIGAWRKSAVVNAGGYLTDTLAEDMDLTWRLRRQGWKHKAETRAIAFTEAPSNIRALFKQRFRWAFGTLQCLWKHRRALFRHGYFGWVALPSMWIFQILFQVLAPLVDLYILYSLSIAGIEWTSRGFYHQTLQPIVGPAPSVKQFGLYYGLFFAIEFLASVIAHLFDKEKLRPLIWLFLQRFVYRQILYAVIFKSLWTALKGTMQGWGKLERKGTVQITSPGAPGLPWIAARKKR